MTTGLRGGGGGGGTGLTPAQAQKLDDLKLINIVFTPVAYTAAVDDYIIGTSNTTETIVTLPTGAADKDIVRVGRAGLANVVVSAPAIRTTGGVVATEAEINLDVGAPSFIWNAGLSQWVMQDIPSTSGTTGGKTPLFTATDVTAAVGDYWIGLSDTEITVTLPATGLVDGDCVRVGRAGAFPVVVAAPAIRTTGGTVATEADINLDVGSPNFVWNAGLSQWIMQDIPSTGSGGTPGTSYTHPQPTPSLVWTINHNLGFRPNAYVEDLTGQPVIGGDITHTDNNNLTITFFSAQAGSADLS